MHHDLGPDPNEGSTDPMVEEYWSLGEDVQDHIRAAGYESDSVEGIAVDIHDLLQASENIGKNIAPAIVAASPNEVSSELHRLRKELEHIRWHAVAADRFLLRALAVLEPANEQPL